ncbi:ankyrin repeat domain-containing protein [Candidatus Tisiphia endosymbiont of Thecophora atra]|uniref:ankyrin repeat domain-containing protein n=1 Tax=Candidatus Tisiphia endosymbiont of Thecophora atra TaxID=3066258 RepID=UPI00312CA899
MSYELCKAAQQGRIENVKLLLSQGHYINEQDDNIRATPLHYAAYHGYVKIVKLLLDTGAELNIPNRYGRTPLHDAAEKGYVDIVELLLNKGAKINAQDNDCNTPLHWAASFVRVNIVELLLDKGADLNIPNRYGRTPLHDAEKNGKTNIVELLRKAKEERDRQEKREAEKAQREYQERIELARINAEKEKAQREYNERIELARINAEKEKAQREYNERIELARINAEKEKAQREYNERIELARINTEKEKAQREYNERIELAKIQAAKEKEQQQFIEKGDKFLRENQHDNAIAQYIAAKKVMNNGICDNYIVHAQEQKRDYQLRQQEESKNKAAQEANILYKKGIELERSLNFDEAEKKYQDANRKCPSKDYEDKISEALKRKKNFEESEKLYNESIVEQKKENYDKAFDLVQKAQGFFPSEKISTLLTNLSQRITTEDNFKKFMDVGKKSYDEGKYESSLIEYQKALKIKPYDQLCKFGVYRVQAYIHESKDNPAAAIKDFETALKLQPHDTNCSIKISKLLIKSNEFEKALSYLEPLRLQNQEIDQLKCKLYTEKGIKSYNNENYKEADFFFQKALEYSEGNNSNREVVLINLAWCCLGKKEFDKSISHLEAAQKLNPQDENIKDIMSLAYNRRGEEYLEQGNNDGAEKSFQNATKLLKDNIYQNNLCTAYLNQKSYEEALEAAQNIDGKGIEYERSISTRTNILEMLTQDFHVTKEEKKEYHAQLTKLHTKSGKYFHQYAKFLVDNNYEASIYSPVIKQGLYVDPNNTDLIGLATDQGMDL